MVSTLLFVAAFCVVAVLVYMARYSSRVRAERTRLIDAPLAEVYAKVVDLTHWGAWNPWLTGEAIPTLSAVSNARGSTWAWDGARSGRGVVEHLAMQDRASLVQRVQLHHPFAVRGKCTWQFSERDGKTEVRWNLRGRVGFSVRAFSRTIQESLLLDLRYGLDRLAQRVEPTDAPHYAMEHLGVREVPDCRYVYQTYEGPIKDLPEALKRITAELRRQLAERGVAEAGPSLAVYVKTNIKLHTTVCHIGMPVGAAEVGAMLVRELAAHPAYVLQLRGDRTALDLAWYLGMQRMVAEDIKPDQRIAPAEHYLSDDAGAEITALHIPVLRA